MRETAQSIARTILHCYPKWERRLQAAAVKFLLNDKLFCGEFPMGTFLNL